ncbi:MAG: GNAT family N-acetyltransferase [Chthoniobacterales bacterium]
MRNNHDASRFELEENGHLAYADYELQGGTLTILHVEAATALRGTGAAGRLMDAIIKHTQEQNLKIHPICSYAAAYLRKVSEKS